MLRHLLSLAVCLLGFGIINAQTPAIDVHFGDIHSINRGSSSVLDDAGGVWFAGTISNGAEGSDDIAIYRIKQSGEILWWHAYGDARNEYVNTIAAGGDGILYACGDVRDPETEDLNAFIMALDTAGNVIWNQEYGEAATNEEFYQLAIAPDATILLTGFHSALTGTGNDVLLARYAPDGALLQDTVFGTDRNEVGMSIVALPGGNIFVSGDRQTIDGYYNPIFIKLSPDFNVINDIDLTSPHNSGCKSMHLNFQGDLYISGETASFATPEFDVLFIVVDTLGNLVTQTGIPSAGPDAGYDIVQLPDSTYAVTGFAYNPAKGENDMLLMHIDSSGNEIDRLFFGETGADMGYDIKVDAIGNCRLSGFHTNADTTFFSLVIAGFPVQTETENIASPERFLSINPNPITESICVQTELEVDRVIVYDNLGRRVGDLPKTSGQCFEWNTLLPKGIYYIQMYTSVGNFTKKIIAG